LSEDTRENEQPRAAEPEGLEAEPALLATELTTLEEGDRQDSTNPGLRPRDVASSPAWKLWGFALIPLVGVIELGLHLYQTSTVPSDRDWLAAKEEVRKRLGPEDQILFSPVWEDPNGRRMFDDLVPIERAARPDDTRFRRVLEVSARGGKRSEVVSWKLAEEVSAGRLKVRVWENPSYVKLVDDLVKHDGPTGFTVVKLDSAGAETPCPWADGPPSTGGTYYPFGPPTPGRRANCSGSFVGLSVIQALDHSARRCFLAPPAGTGQAVRVRFPNIGFGTVIHGHHGLHYDVERHKAGAPITLTFRSGDLTLGSSTHRDGQGWSGFELPTAELAGKHAELVVDITSHGGGGKRTYCFEADTR
jgi:hypothetical protein